MPAPRRFLPQELPIDERSTICDLRSLRPFDDETAGENKNPGLSYQVGVRSQGGSMKIPLHDVGRRGCFASAARPVCMEELSARLIDALVHMRAKIIALRLQQVGRQAGISESVKVI